jgi:hypothetical protein
MNNAREEYEVNETLGKFFGIDLIQAYKENETDVTQKELLKSIREELANMQLMLAGGAIVSIMTGQTVNDLDFYLKDAEMESKAVEYFQRWFPEQPFFSPNAITFKRKSQRSNKVWTVQLIKRFKGTPEEIFSTFDFTITQALYDFSNAEFVFGERFFQDLAQRRLVYLGGSRYPICAMYRTKKYQDRGFKLPGSTIMHIALSIVQLDIKTYGQLKDQLMGVDTMYLQGLLGQDRYAQELPVDYGMFLEEIFSAFDGEAFKIDKE